MTARRALVPVCALLLLVLAPAAQAKKKGTPTGPLDEGRLEPTWFGGPLPFKEVDDHDLDVDYLWVKDGFAIDGHSFHFVDWPEPVFLGDSEPDANDRRLARQMNNDLPQMFQETLADDWKGKATTSLTSGDVKVEGRIVDCSTGSTAAKVWVGFGAGAGNTTLDLKFVDAKSGELLAALHQRVVSGSTWSTTDSKLANWIDELGVAVAQKGLANLYAKGDSVDD
ncbi:MAG TPA: DUF4410 domain-containing protein [Thermoanaerobaculia bacterium]|jgi:hypothetical protein|nr:DUF4410 domain-containing protein [Thermoanaerobaculia bacterium]